MKDSLFTIAFGDRKRKKKRSEYDQLMKDADKLVKENRRLRKRVFGKL